MDRHTEGWSDKIKGAVNQAKGEAKDQWGNLTDDPGLQARGKWDKAKGKVQEQIGEWKENTKSRTDR
ncbi:CsbD family protein [Cohnella rhizosphaerae]|uniref:CsbD family protein n=1 Tax=Cohnella rhizosphaerae TaxID=1457232 RepID=A0A9X4L6M2_9BACL|nr:CsbD family protein [Cohnella rhizosphaerae]MDG0814447.1 CsbD family protein [Cohnella rhizosphaerae]